MLVTILATDKGSPPLSSASLLNISITDVNDNPPTFSQRNYSVTVSEGAPVGEVVVTVSRRSWVDHWTVRTPSSFYRCLN